MLSKILILLTGVLLLSACDPAPLTKKDENIIGDALKDVSALNNDNGVEQSKVVLYDEVVGRIHQFDLLTNTHVKSVRSLEPTGEHTVLYDQTADFIVDMTNKNVTIFDSNGKGAPSPLHFVGTPVSAAFRPSLGYLVIYDNLMSVGILKIGPTGGVLKFGMRGPLLGSIETIAAGDVDGNGRLILAMSSGTIAIVDLEATLNQDQWVYTSFASGLTDIKWLAPVRGDTDKFMTVSSGKISLFQVSTQTIIDQQDIDNTDVVKYSKSIDPHVLTAEGNLLKLHYVEGAALQTRQVTKQIYFLIASRLDKTGNTWSIVNSNSSSVKKNRTVKQWRFSDMLALSEVPLRDESKLELASHSVFQLFPSPMGYALNLDLFKTTNAEIKNFNLKLIP
jgi:hypothetical protein